MTFLDGFRIVILAFNAVCIMGLLWRRFNPPNDEWNPKTKDYWFALLLFSISAAAATTASLIEDQDWTPRLVLSFVASLVCINGLRRKGRWRGDGLEGPEIPIKTDPPC